MGAGPAVTIETVESSEDELGRLDIDLDRKSKQHNLTSSNVRAILHVSVSVSHAGNISPYVLCVTCLCPWSGGDYP